MKTIAKTLFFAAAAAAALALNVAHAAVESGQPAPDFTLTDTAGKTHKLSDYKGKVVVLEWTNSGSPVVQRHYKSGNMQSTQKAAAEAGAVWLQINTSGPGSQGNLSAQEAQAWQKKMGVTAAAYLHDASGKVGRLYGAQATPHMYVINTDGTLAYQGAIDDNPSAREAETMKSNNYVKAAIAALKDGKPVEKSATKAYGCGVKYPRSDT